jgi:hypothetical protein
MVIQRTVEIAPGQQVALAYLAAHSRPHCCLIEAVVGSAQLILRSDKEVSEARERKDEERMEKGPGLYFADPISTGQTIAVNLAEQQQLVGKTQSEGPVILLIRDIYPDCS